MVRKFHFLHGMYVYLVYPYSVISYEIWGGGGGGNFEGKKEEVFPGSYQDSNSLDLEKDRLPEIDQD